MVEELQRRLPEPYFCIAQDTFTDVIAPCLSGNYNGIKADDLWYCAVIAMYHTIRLYSDLGYNVIVDHVVLNKDDGKEQRYFDECLDALHDYPLLMVKVTCPLEQLKLREIKRGDREVGTAEAQEIIGLYPCDNYDAVVNTHIASLTDCAECIIQKLSGIAK